VDPLVSILIPAYNSGRFIEATVKSALAQSWPNKEIIIVDDGSRDDTLAIARGLATRIINVVSQENQGAAAARNKAGSLAQGQYIQWLDADDLLAAEKVASQMRVALGAPSRQLFSSGWAHFYHRPSRASFMPTALWRDSAPVEWLVLKMGNYLHMQTGTWLVSRSLTEAAGPWDVRLSFDDDGEYFTRIVAASEGIQFVPEARTFYRRSGSSSLSFVGKSEKKLESLFLSMQLHIAHLRKLEDSERTRSACVRYINHWLAWFYPSRYDLVQQLGELAASLGGQIEHPSLPWKYSWIQKTMGWAAAKKTQHFYNHCKAAALESWDKFLFQREEKKREL
jgi:glycosyltransferase involved in cell wall biosynthesis